MADLTDLVKRRVGRLSGGQVQRVRFALAIAGAPKLLVLDGPTAAMDVEARRPSGAPSGWPPTSPPFSPPRRPRGTTAS
ncbi:ATP-binding cassette domain-containing protein [Streptosporangium canum]|uniref:ATP-binding cassette domain-containing protein n=1 Tax=Streptosporangium canum TaxID=324952 RepID=UPI0033BC1280